MENVETIELQAHKDSRNSFYGKALVIKFTNEKGEYISQLKSYNTLVAEYNHTTNKMQVFGWFSQTTGRHINEFLDLYGFDSATKKQMENWEADNNGQ